MRAERWESGNYRDWHNVGFSLAYNQSNPLIPPQ